MSNFKDSFTFDEVYPDFDTFLTSVKELTVDDVSRETHEYLFRYIQNRYFDSTIRYSRKLAFKRQFMTTYANKSKMFEFIKKAIDAQYTLTMDELSVTSSTFQTTAKNDAALPIFPLDEAIRFVNQQNADKTRTNKLTAYLNAVESASDRHIEDFLSFFAPHFQQIHTPKIYTFGE